MAPLLIILRAGQESGVVYDESECGRLKVVVRARNRMLQWHDLRRKTIWEVHNDTEAGLGCAYAVLRPDMTLQALHALGKKVCDSNLEAGFAVAGPWLFLALNAYMWAMPSPPRRPVNCWACGDGPVDGVLADATIGAVFPACVMCVRKMRGSWGTVAQPLARNVTVTAGGRSMYRTRELLLVPGKLNKASSIFGEEAAKIHPDIDAEIRHGGRLVVIAQKRKLNEVHARPHILQAIADARRLDRPRPMPVAAVPVARMPTVLAAYCAQEGLRSCVPKLNAREASVVADDIAMSAEAAADLRALKADLELFRRVR